MSDTGQSNDRSKYIRTYAKDVAALTGSAAPSHATQTQPAPPPPAPEPAKPSPWEVPQATREVSAMYSAPEPKEDRAAILDRLRAKLKDSAYISVEPPPAGAAPAPAHVSTPPPPPPLPTPPIEREAPAAPARIHTYKSDFAEQVDEKGASAFSVLAAQADANTKPKPTFTPKKSRVALVISSVLMLVFGASGIFAAYWYVSRLAELPASPASVPSLVFADEHMKLAGSGPELMQALADAADEPLVDGNVLITYLSESTTTPKGETKEVPLAGGALIRALQLPAPDILLRNIAPQSTVGIVSAGVETRPFFILRVTSFERTFAGMLAWEETMARDLELLYPSRSAPAVNPEATAINLATSTPVSQPPRPRDEFSDAVVESHDVRVLKDTAGQTLMLYGYADKETLIIARDEAAFAGLLVRLQD